MAWGSARGGSRNPVIAHGRLIAEYVPNPRCPKQEIIQHSSQRESLTATRLLDGYYVTSSRERSSCAEES